MLIVLHNTILVSWLMEWRSTSWKHPQNLALLVLYSYCYYSTVPILGLCPSDPSAFHWWLSPMVEGITPQKFEKFQLWPLSWHPTEPDHTVYALQKVRDILNHHDTVYDKSQLWCRFFIEIGFSATPAQMLKATWVVCFEKEMTKFIFQTSVAFSLISSNI